MQSGKVYLSNSSNMTTVTLFILQANLILVPARDIFEQLTPARGCCAGSMYRGETLTVVCRPPTLMRGRLPYEGQVFSFNAP